jgi:hypothetical protein
MRTHWQDEVDAIQAQCRRGKQRLDAYANLSRRLEHERSQSQSVHLRSHLWAALRQVYAQAQREYERR